MRKRCACCVVAVLLLGLVSFPMVGGGNPKGVPADRDSLLRAEGPAGLEALLAEYDARRADANADPATLAQLRSTIDAVAAQRDAHVSRLYWYTDLEQAKAQAAAREKPILSLRLLGTLDTELSCANSRFFRTALYANAEISGYLREHYILHWQSVRPVPKITIDFGDGRKIERTITGNSIHYVLAPDGRVVDALPGLYAPATFLEIVKAAGAVASSPGRSAETIRAYQELQSAALQQAWRNDLNRVVIATNNPPEPPPTPQHKAAPTARAANERSVAKRAMEARPTDAVLATRPRAPESIDDLTWQSIATLHAAAAKLDRASVEMIRAKQGSGNARAAGRLARTKAFVEDPMIRVVAHFERSIAEDTVRNQYLFRTRILKWLIAGGESNRLDALNERVYAELFLTPSSDPWLGLLPEDAYAGIDGGGIVIDAPARSGASVSR